MQPDETKKSIPRSPSIETQELVRFIEPLSEGEEVSYKKLSEIVMGDIQTKKQHCLRTALGILEREHKTSFNKIRGQGIIVLNNSGKIEATKAAPIRANKMFKRNMRKLSSVKFEELDESQRRNYNIQLSTVGVLIHVTKRKQVEKIETEVHKAHDRLMIDRTLDLFK